MNRNKVEKKNSRLVTTIIVFKVACLYTEHECNTHFILCKIVQAKRLNKFYPTTLIRFFSVKEILRGLCAFLGWHLVTATSEGKQLCYYVPETLQNIFEMFSAKLHHNHEL